MKTSMAKRILRSFLWSQGRQMLDKRVNTEKEQLERNETREEIKTECWIRG